MKTLPTTDQIKVKIHNGNRFFLTVAGIATAVLCCMALWYEANPSAHIDAKTPRLLVLETQKSITL